MKNTYINKIKSLFTELDNDSFGFFFGRSFTINNDCEKYDVLEVVNDDDSVMVNCIGYSAFIFKNFNIEELSANTIKKILKKIEESVAEE